MAEFSAVLHTRMDKVNENMTRARALQSFLPSLAGFLSNDDVASASLKGAAEAEPPPMLSRDWETSSTTPRRDGLSQKRARFGTWTSSLGCSSTGPWRSGSARSPRLAGSAVPRESRFLFLFEPEEVTRLWSRVKRATA